MEEEYHHIIGVRTVRADSGRPKLSCDFVITITPDQITKSRLAESMYKNKLWKTTYREAIEAVGLQELDAALWASKIRASSNMMTIHKFVTNFEMTREDFDIFVQAANVSDGTLKKLMDGKIGGG